MNMATFQKSEQFKKQKPIDLIIYTAHETFFFFFYL